MELITNDHELFRNLHTKFQSDSFKNEKDIELYMKLVKILYFSSSIFKINFEALHIFQIFSSITGYFDLQPLIHYQQINCEEEILMSFFKIICKFLLNFKLKVSSGRFFHCIGFSVKAFYCNNMELSRKKCLIFLKQC